MNHKVLGSVFVLAVALGMISVAVRSPQNTTTAGPAATKPATQATKDISRPLACYRVREEGIVNGMNYNGADYRASVSETEVRFGGKEQGLRFGAPKIEQGQTSIDCTNGGFQHPAYGVARLERGPITEEYVFENRRAEQLFRLAKPVGEGALRVRIPVTSEFGGAIETRSARSGKFEDIQFKNGGVAFLDSKGSTAAAYYGAVAIDADGKQLALAPRHENGQIVLEVAAAFMEKATYPVVIDPWLELGSSATGGGITNTQAASDRPSISQTPSGNPFIAWSDNTTGNYQVYVLYWNGFRFTDLGGASLGGGLSANSGDSVNPQISCDPNGLPGVCWEDNTDGRVGIFFKRYNGVTTTWEELDKSASVGGLSVSFTGPALHPHVIWLPMRVQDPITPLNIFAPMIVWEEGNNIEVAWHYPGDGRSTPATPGWYFIGPVNTPSGFSAASPSISIDATGRPVVAWQDSSSGNFEIYVRRLQDVQTPANAGLPFQITAEPAGVTQVRLPSGIKENLGWVGISGSDTGSGVSASPSQLSLWPSVACDVNNISVAWQETLPGGATALNSEIFFSRSSGIGAFSIPENVSNTTGSSIFPSLDASFGRLVIAWVEDPDPTVTNATPNSEIYVRGKAAAGANWLQIGVQGSAAPLTGPDTVFAEGGISHTPNISQFPQVKMDTFGSPTVIWSDGAQGKLDIFLRTFSPNGPGFTQPNASTGLIDFITNLRQTFDDPNLVPGTLDVPLALPVSATTLFFSANVFTEPNLVPPATTLRLQVEIAEASSGYQNSETKESLTTPSGSVAVVKFTGLVNRNYRWRVRTIDDVGRFSPLVEFTNIGGTSFQVNSAVVTSGTPNTAPVLAGNAKSKGACGLLGLEAAALLGLIRILRRKRSK